MPIGAKNHAGEISAQPHNPAEVRTIPAPSSPPPAANKNNPGLGAIFPGNRNITIPPLSDPTQCADKTQPASPEVRPNSR